MVAQPHQKRIRWHCATRIISSIYPPIDLFEDCADPEDWELLVALESKSNPRMLERVGTLSMVPAERRVSGPGASYLMSPFVHVHPDWSGRFHDGTFGAYYAADRLETALRETMFHRGRIYRASAEAPGWFSQYRELVGRLDAQLHSLEGEGFSIYLQPETDYAQPQALARRLRDEGSQGIHYPSVRDPAGYCIAAFWPNVPETPREGRHFSYHFNGEEMDYYRDEASGEVFRCFGSR